MSIRFGTISRGAGKIYVRVEAGAGAGSPRWGSLRSAAHTLQGDAVPSEVFPIPDAEGYVLVLPVLAVPQRASVSLLDKDGKVVESAEHTLHPRETALRSRLNTLTRNATALGIRNADTRWHMQAATIQVTDILPDGDRSIVRGTITSTPASREVAQLPFDVRAVGPDGRDASLRPWVDMGDKTYQDADSASGLVRKTNFSLLLPANLPSFVVWVTSTDTRAPHGFLACEDFFVADKRRQGEDLFRDTEFDPRYDGWFRDLHRTGQRELARQRAHSPEQWPTFSVVLLCDGGEDSRESARSVLAQTHGKLELLLAGSSQLGDLAQDGRVRTVTCAAGCSHARAADAGMAAARGDFVCFVHAGDLLEPDALYHYGSAIDHYPTTDLLYCDEDKLDQGRYVEPYFKSDWNHDLLMCTDYVGNLLCIRRTLLDDLDPRPSEVDNAWQYDLTLRASERARNIYHERRVLFHAGGKAAAHDASSASAAAALQQHLDRLGIDATAAQSDKVPGTCVVDYHVPSQDGPLVSILIPNKDLAPILERCLTSIERLTTYRNYEVVVIENASEEQETFDLYERIPALDARMRVVTYVPDEPGFSYAKVINFGASQAHGEYLLTLNNDTEVLSPHWIEHLLDPLMREEVGATGAKLLYPDDTIQHAGVSFCVRNGGPYHEGTMMPADTASYHSQYQLSRDVCCVTGACTMTRRSLWDALGGLDESFAVNYNDVDFCLRLRQHGKLVVYCPQAVLRHYESISRGEHIDGASGIQFCREMGLLMQRWAPYYVEGDEYTGPHLFGPYHTLYLESA